MCTEMLNGSLLLPVIASVVFVSSCRQPLPELPRVTTSSFPATVREQIEAARCEAQHEPRDAGASGRYGMVLHAYVLDDAASVCYRRAARLDSKSARWPYYLGLILQRQKRYSEAVAQFRAALSNRPDDHAIRLHLASALAAAGQASESRKLYSEVVAAAPGMAEAHYGLGRLAEEAADYEEAIRHYQDAIASYPGYREALFALGQVYRRIGNAERTRELLERYREASDVPPPSQDSLREELVGLDRSTQGYVRRAVSFERAGKLSDAIREFENALSVDARNNNAHINLISLYAQTGEFRQAEDHYRKAVALNPTEAYAHFNFANALAAQRRFSEAAALLPRAIAANPKLTPAHTLLGDLKMALGKRAEAEQSYRAALDLRRDDLIANRGLGYVLAQRGRCAEAIPHLERAQESSGRFAVKTILILAGCYHRQGDRSKARTLLDDSRGIVLGHASPSELREFDLALAKTLTPEKP